MNLFQVLKITAPIYYIRKPVQKTETFRVQDFLLDLSDKPDRPNTPLFYFYNDNCRKLDGFKKGDMVTVEFTLRGRQWHYDDKKGVQNQLPARAIYKYTLEEQQGAAAPSATEEDDLPF